METAIWSGPQTRAAHTTVPFKILTNKDKIKEGGKEKSIYKLKDSKSLNGPRILLSLRQSRAITLMKSEANFVANILEFHVCHIGNLATEIKHLL